jgi:hypothetical protein
VTGDPVKAFLLGMRMIKLITFSRISRNPFPGPPPEPASE